MRNDRYADEVNFRCDCSNVGLHIFLYYQLYQISGLIYFADNP